MNQIFSLLLLGYVLRINSFLISSKLLQNKHLNRVLFPTATVMRSEIIARNLVGGFSLQYNLLSEQEIALFKVIAIPLGVYLIFYKPIERTESFLLKISELLRVGKSQELLSNGKPDERN